MWDSESLGSLDEIVESIQASLGGEDARTLGQTLGPPATLVVLVAERLGWDADAEDDD